MGKLLSGFATFWSRVAWSLGKNDPAGVGQGFPAAFDRQAGDIKVVIEMDT